MGTTVKHYSTGGKKLVFHGFLITAIPDIVLKNCLPDFSSTIAFFFLVTLGTFSVMNQKVSLMFQFFPGGNLHLCDYV